MIKLLLLFFLFFTAKLYAAAEDDNSELMCTTQFCKVCIKLNKGTFSALKP